MQGIARTTMSIAKNGPTTAAALTPGSGQTVRRPAMPVDRMTLIMVGDMDLKRQYKTLKESYTEIFMSSSLRKKP